jgi:hypothetical protein
MISVKEMPYQEKIEAVIRHTALYRSVLQKFAEIHLGEDAVDELEQTWLKGSQRTPVTATPAEEYRIAYANWIWTAKSGFRFVRELMGEEGVRWLEQMLLHALIQQNKGWSLVMLNLVRLASPNQAFKMLEEQLSYNLQWQMAYSVIESSPRKLVLGIDRCQVLEYPETDDVCRACREVFPAWAVSQLMVDMNFERTGPRCTCTVRPLGGD